MLRQVLPLLRPHLFDLAVHALDEALYYLDPLDNLLLEYPHSLLHRLLIVVVICALSSRENPVDHEVLIDCLVETRTHLVSRVVAAADSATGQRWLRLSVDLVGLEVLTALGGRWEETKCARSRIVFVIDGCGAQGLGSQGVLP